MIFPLQKILIDYRTWSNHANIAHINIYIHEYLNRHHCRRHRSEKHSRILDVEDEIASLQMLSKHKRDRHYLVLPGASSITVLLMKYRYKLLWNCTSYQVPTYVQCIIYEPTFRCANEYVDHTIRRRDRFPHKCQRLVIMPRSLIVVLTLLQTRLS